MPLGNGRRADIMAIDANGGQGMPGAFNVASMDAATRARQGLAPGVELGRARTYVGAMCSVNDPMDAFPLSTPAATQPL